MEHYKDGLIEDTHYYTNGDRVVFTALFHIQHGIKQQIIKEYNNHYDVNKLAIQFNLSRITIKNHLQQWGIFKDQRKTYQRKGGYLRKNT